MSEEIKPFPRLSAFESLLGKVYMEVWDLQDQPTAYANRIRRFLRIWLPSMYQDKFRQKMPDYDEKVKEMEAEKDNIISVGAAGDPFDQDHAENVSAPSREAEFADEVWHAIIDVLTEAGFNFPLERYMGFFDPSRGKKSGAGKQEGFPAKLPDVVL